jgi:hypothetical protein
MRTPRQPKKAALIVLVECAVGSAVRPRKHQRLEPQNQGVHEREGIHGRTRKTGS